MKARGDLPGHLGDRAGRDSCRLTVTHDQLRADANSELYGGWPMILSGLKTLLETGETLDDAGLAQVRGRYRLITSLERWPATASGASSQYAVSPVTSSGLNFPARTRSMIGSIAGRA